MNIICTRDDVASGDDQIAHRFIVPNGISLVEILRLILAQHHLPTIAGGRATWVAYLQQQPVAVLAQQWQKPVILTNLPLQMEVALHFRYLRQHDPEEVLASLRRDKDEL